MKLIRTRLTNLLLASVILTLPLALSGCAPKETAPVAQSEQKSTPVMAKVIATDPQMQAVLAKHASLGPKPIESLTPVEARRQPTIADAVKALLQERG